VPALVDDGALVTESSYDVPHLTGCSPPRASDARWASGRGSYLSWLAYYGGVLEPVGNLHFAGLGADERLRRTFRDLGAAQARVLAALEAGPYLLGKEFSGADILVASMGHFVRELLPPGDVVDAYLARCNARPALARAFARDRG
jgi:glutathione S-transferase